MISIQRIDVTRIPEIRIFFTVVSPDGRSVLGLTDREIKVNIDGDPQKILDINSALQGGEALSIALLFDRSGSMKNALVQAQEAAVEFLRRISTGDRIAVISFDDKVRLDAGFSSDKTAVENTIRSIALGRDTALYDAIAAGLDLFENDSSQRQAIVVLSDGKDTKSTSNIFKILEKVKDSEIPIFSIGLGKDIEEESLRKLASESGGNFFKAAAPEDLLLLYQSVAEQLNNQYVLVFSSTPGQDSKMHELEVVVEAPAGSVISEKRKYIASSGPGFSPETLDRGVRSEQMKKGILFGAAGAFTGLLIGILIVMLIKMTRRELRVISAVVFGLVLSSIFLGAAVGLIIAFI
jgi:VWFA-related protein